MKLVSALMKFFGKKKDQTIQEFVDEAKRLTPTDKEELKTLLGKELGQKIED